MSTDDPAEDVVREAVRRAREDPEFRARLEERVKADRKRLKRMAQGPKRRRTLARPVPVISVVLWGVGWFGLGFMMALLLLR